MKNNKCDRCGGTGMYPAANGEDDFELEVCDCGTEMKIEYPKFPKENVADKLIGMIYKGTDIPDLGNYPKRINHGF